MVVYQNLPVLISSGGGGGGGSTVSNQDTAISINDTGSNGSINISTNNVIAMAVASNQLIGVNSTVPVRRLDINDINGNCLRLIYNDALGRSIRYTDFLIDSIGNLQISPIGGNIKIPSNTGSTGLYIGNTLITSTADQINTLSIGSYGVAEFNKALILNNNGNIQGINTISSNNINCNNITGTITTSNQPNITSIGNLSVVNAESVLIGGTDTKIKIYSNSGILYLQPYITESTGSASDLFIGNYNQTYNDSNRKFIIKSNGLVGIGTTSPNKSLEIFTSSGDCLRLTNNNNYTDLNILSDGSLNILNHCTYLNYTSNSSSVGYPLVLKRNINTPSIGVGTGLQFNINEVLYGQLTVTTESTIDQDGLLQFSLANNGTVTNVMQLNSFGTLRVQNLTELSDERSKENIFNMDTEILFNNIMCISIKKFNMKNDKSLCTGVIAQEIKKIMPDAVDIFEYNNIKDFHSIKTKEILYTLIGAFQHLVNELKLNNN